MKASEFLSNFNSSANSPDEYYIWVSFMLAFLLTFYYTCPKKCRFKKKSNAQFLNFFGHEKRSGSRSAIGQVMGTFSVS